MAQSGRWRLCGPRSCASRRAFGEDARRWSQLRRESQFSFKMGEQQDAFLFIGIGTGNDGRGWGRGHIGGHVRHTCRDIEEIACVRHYMVFQLVAVPSLDLTGKHIDGRLMALVQVGFGPCSRWYGEDVHADSGSTHVLWRAAVRQDRS